MIAFYYKNKYFKPIDYIQFRKGKKKMKYIKMSILNIYN